MRTAMISMFALFLIAGLVFTPARARAADRVYFADAKISFVVPDGWHLTPSFPFGPLFDREGSSATIACAISQPLSQNRVQTDLPINTLKELAHSQISRMHGTMTAEKERAVASQNAVSIRWQDAQHIQHSSAYFFVENRIYALALQATSEDFDTMAEGFDRWLNSIQILRNHDSGALRDPTHGGLWIHQTAGAKIRVPESWLVGAVNERLLGVVIRDQKAQGAWTVTVDAVPSDLQGLSDKQKLDLRKAVEGKGFKIVSESAEPFHGLPSYRLLYEGYRGERFIHATDMLVVSPKAHWLFSFDADSALFRSLAPQYAEILSAVQFF